MIHRFHIRLAHEAPIDQDFTLVSRSRLEMLLTQKRTLQWSRSLPNNLPPKIIMRWWKTWSGKGRRDSRAQENMISQLIKVVLRFHLTTPWGEPFIETLSRILEMQINNGGRKCDLESNYFFFLFRDKLALRFMRCTGFIFNICLLNWEFFIL